MGYSTYCSQNNDWTGNKPLHRYLIDACCFRGYRQLNASRLPTYRIQYPAIVYNPGTTQAYVSIYFIQHAFYCISIQDWILYKFSTDVKTCRVYVIYQLLLLLSAGVNLKPQSSSFPLSRIWVSESLGKVNGFFRNGPCWLAWCFNCSQELNVLRCRLTLNRIRTVLMVITCTLHVHKNVFVLLCLLLPVGWDTGVRVVMRGRFHVEIRSLLFGV